MRRFVSVAKGLILVCLALAVCPARAAHAECHTQGILALALAQVLDYNVTTQDAAIAALQAIGTEPLNGWKPAECLSEQTVIQVEEALRRAVTAGRVSKEAAMGAVAAALNAIGAAEFVAALDRALPYPPSGGEHQRGLVRSTPPAAQPQLSPFLPGTGQ